MVKINIFIIIVTRTIQQYCFITFIILYHANLETFRLHPPVPAINRTCTKKYTIPDSAIKFDVGEKLFIPIYSLHHDSKYYPNPEKFDPERFTEENQASRPHGTFLPFGDGPRICIGKKEIAFPIQIKSLVNIVIV